MSESENFLITIEKIRSELLANQTERLRILADLERVQAQCKHLKIRRTYDMGWRERKRCEICDKEW